MAAVVVGAVVLLIVVAVLLLHKRCVTQKTYPLVSSTSLKKHRHTRSAPAVFMGASMLERPDAGVTGSHSNIESWSFLSQDAELYREERRSRRPLLPLR